MSHLAYYNSSVQINDIFYESHKNLIEKVCKDLDSGNKVDELVKKYLDKPDLKAKKDPNKPKKPKSSFLLFCDEERSKLIEKEKKGLKKGEKFNLGAVQKKLGEMWGKLSKDKKSKFDMATEKAKEEYYDKLTDYETSINEC
tara:strand:- start:151 stop:576 length:426 start_codon:yes stop_codon:yes gene_type:complete